MSATVIRHGPVSVYLGEKSGKYPDGNQVTVRGADTLVAFDTPLVANRLGAELLDADLIVLGHVHEDHMAGLRRLPRTPVQAHELDVEAARSWEGLARHYGYAPGVLAGMRAMIEEKFLYVPRPDAQPYGDGACWDLGGGVRVTRVPHAGAHAGAIACCSSSPAASPSSATSTCRPSDRTTATRPPASPISAARSRRVKEIPARVWITSHHKGVITERETFLALLKAFAARLTAREEAIAAFLEQRPSTLAELVAHRFVYPPQLKELFYEDAERRTIEQHLQELALAGRALEERGRWRLCSLRKPA